MPTDEKQACAKITTDIASWTFQINVEITSEFRVFLTINNTFYLYEYTG